MLGHLGGFKRRPFIMANARWRIACELGVITVVSLARRDLKQAEIADLAQIAEIDVARRLCDARVGSAGAIAVASTNTGRRSDPPRIALRSIQATDSE